MPYKHIAAHLKKTELACRLHYHQLSHGSNRRKRTTSISSGSSTGGHSPIMLASIPSPIHENDGMGTSSRSTSPPGSAGSYAPTSPNSVQLPSIMNAGTSTDASPRLPTILPKPASMTLALASATVAGSPTASRGYPTPLAEHHPHSAPLMASAPYRGSMTPTSASMPVPPHSARPHHQHHPHHPHLPGPLRLDCSALPPPPSSAGLSSGPPTAGGSYGSMTHSASTSHPVDMSRLAAVYAAHRASFWAAVAADYGACANPLVLEQAWRGGGSSASSSQAGSMMAAPGGVAAHTPITPVGSPDEHMYPGKGGQGQDKTRISAILGIDANPRSPREREMVRRLEEERCSVAVVGA
ncbi:hypothetical protein CONLIGDRAFT_629133 [Coniochaeta ligniaria NRRL 30616]|uniref:Uncharacterized protein n=1 Tax=Coniochaeta ligniaria NRRL 30616 TaxID=1408157 RepID=A0A1J7JVV3_9PEZI|nr:hypothetical protein CONLIGDRAFT_629133 [Coniochaeta ligniaria NRRL 30616]